MIADITGVPTIRSSDRKVGAKGAFICALVATGAESDFAHAAHSTTRLATSSCRIRIAVLATLRCTRSFSRCGIAAKGWQRLADARVRTSES